MASPSLNRFMALFGISLATLLGGCGANPTSRDVVGTWINADGATLTIEENGQFTARSLPQTIFWRRDQPGPAFDGKGTWKLHEGSPYLEVKLGFDELWGKPASREITVLVSGSGGSTYLYMWEEEEGGNRYKLVKK
jgi:hypothetical protein